MVYFIYLFMNIGKLCIEDMISL